MGMGAPMVVLKLIEKGTRPDLSKVQDDQMRRLLSECWSANPDQRPEFGAIQPQLEEVKQKRPSTKQQWRVLEDLLEK